MWKIVKNIEFDSNGTIAISNKEIRECRTRFGAILYLKWCTSWDGDEEFGMSGASDKAFSISYTLCYERIDDK